LHDELPLVPPKIVPYISGLHDHAAALLDLLPAGVRSCAVARTAAVQAAVLAELRNRGRWLLVFDNAEDPADVTPWLPGGAGPVAAVRRDPVPSDGVAASVLVVAIQVAANRQ
jgi:hypothetical protein